MNPSAGGLLGGTEYEGYGTGRCNCTFEKFYPWMIQPRLGVSYQLNPKTVLHAGYGFYSGPQLFMNEEIYSNQGFGFNQVFLTSPSYGIAAGQLSNGIPYSPAAITATHFDPGAYPNIGQLNSPPPFIVPNNGRPPRFQQTTFGVEREIVNNLTVKYLYIDNRGVWLNSDGLTNTTNELTPSILLKKYGLNVTNANRLQPADAADLFSRRGGKRLHGSVLHFPVRSHPGSGITAIPAIRRHWRLLRAQWQLVVRRASNQGYQAAQQRIVGRPRLLVVEESGNSGSSTGVGQPRPSDLSYDGTDSGSLPPAQEPEIL